MSNNVTPIYYKQRIIILDTSDSSYTSTGSLFLYGGMNIVSTVNSVDVSSGAVVMSGGVGISGNIYGTFLNTPILQANSTATIGSLNSSTTYVTNVTNSIGNFTNVTTNNLFANEITASNVKVQNASSEYTTLSNLIVGDATYNSIRATMVNVSNHVSIGSTLISTDVIAINQTTGEYIMTRSTVGNLVVNGNTVVKGGVNVKKDVVVAGNAIVDGNLIVDGTVTYINSTISNFAEPFVLLNTNPNGTYDAGYIGTIDSSNNDYAAAYYNNTSNAFIFALTDSTPLQSNITPGVNIDICVGDSNFVGNVNVSSLDMNVAGSTIFSPSQTIIGSLTTNNVSSVELEASSITTSNIIVNGSSSLTFPTPVPISNISNTDAVYHIENALVVDIKPDMIVGTNVTSSSLIVNSVNMTPNLDDIITEQLTVLNNNQTLPLAITGLSFQNAYTRCFDAFITVRVYGTPDLNSLYNLQGVQFGSSGNWNINSSFIGDDIGIVFSIDTSGQVYYTSDTYTGYTAGSFGFTANTLTI